MNLSFDGANTKVYDDVITEEEFKNIFDFINDTRLPLDIQLESGIKSGICQKEEFQEVIIFLVIGRNSRV